MGDEMLSLKALSTFGQILGLLLTTAGAIVAAKAVIISEQQAETIAGTYFNSNKALKASLLSQSNSAKWGLWLVAAGTLLQLIGTMLPLWE